jgi:hypothetical protein
MNERPRLPSEMHPDYPKRPPLKVENGRTIYRPIPAEQIMAFYQAHPEFANEGEYRFECPFCGYENHFEDKGGWCCGEVGHCEWVLVKEGAA